LKKKAAAQEAAAEAQVNEHFDQMEEDRYNGYDAPSLGNEYTTSEDTKFDDPGVDVFGWNIPSPAFYIGLAGLCGGGLYYLASE
jgi:hypothetical protein